MKKILWIRELSCGHERPTNIAFICNKYEKPKISDGCFCRECNENVDILKIREADDKLKEELREIIKKNKK